ncbi:MAG: putative sulfate exporter family transporter [Candidatus Thermoplasmatota archaeon]|nr:putative sulfate exporter family transporter [Candidatus Thermoplasmatota archaeon]
MSETSGMHSQKGDLDRGIMLCLFLGIMAYLIDGWLQSSDIFSLGSGTTAFILGGVCAQFFTGIQSGGDWVIKKILPITIICLGFGLDLTLLFGDGEGRIGLMIGITSAFFCLVSSVLIGRLLGITTELSLAVGCGGAICGNSAVVSVSSPLGIRQNFLALILATINILGVITFIAIPVFSTILGLEETSAGIWAGSTIHAVPQAISAGEAIGEEGMIMATTVKLSRVGLLVLVIPLCALIGGRPAREGYWKNPLSKMPYFLPGFILAAILATWLIPEEHSEQLSGLAKFSLAPIMASIGFFLSMEGIGREGTRIFAIGALSSVAMIFFSLIMIYLFV